MLSKNYSIHPVDSAISRKFKQKFREIVTKKNFVYTQNLKIGFENDPDYI